MHRWNESNKDQQRHRMKFYENNAVNGLHNELSAMDNDQRKHFIDFVQSY